MSNSLNNISAFNGISTSKPSKQERVTARPEPYSNAVMGAISTLSLNKPTESKSLSSKITLLNEAPGGKETSAKINKIVKYGNLYIGKFDPKTITGNGTIQFANKNEYIGPFEEGKPHGVGKLTFASGNQFVGNFKHGIMSGEGTFIYKNGDRYQGSFIDGKMTGRAEIEYSDGKKYEGDVVDGTPQGKGRFFYINGYVYEGDIVNGMPQGNGTFTIKNGDVYVGDIKNGFPNGKGKFSFADGDEYDGDVVNGDLNGKGIYTFKNGDVYIGDTRDGKAHGQGDFLWLNGNRYKGSFSNWMICGQGVLQYSNTANNESEYAGFFKNGLRHGYGVLTNNDGFKIEGNWNKDSLLLNKSSLSHPFFLSSFLDGSSFDTGSGPISLFADYFSSKKKHSNIAKALRSILEAKSAKDILKKLLGNPDSAAQLVRFDTHDHAMLLQIRPNRDHLILKVFNSGEGINDWHDECASRDSHFQTALEIQIPKESMSLDVMQRLLKRFESVDEAYQFLYSIEGAQKIDVENPVWQKEQKGLNCTIECIFAYLKNTLGETAYAEMRLELFDDCIKAVKESNDPKALAFLEKLEAKKKKRIEKMAKARKDPSFPANSFEHKEAKKK